MACLSKEFKCKKKENAMVKLSTSNLLWYIYQRNCEVGYPTVISMSQFCAEFPEATHKDIINELDNLINGMHFIHRRFLCVYDLTEEGLEEALHLRNFVVNPCKQVWWVRVLQIIVRKFFNLKKITALIFIVSSLSLTLRAEVTNEAADSISGNVNCHIVDNTQMEILKNRISLLERMFDSQKNQISQRCAQEVARASDRLNIECAKQIGVVSDKYESEFDRQSGDLKSQYEVAYKNLRDDYDKFTDRLGNWLTVIGIFVALLGVALPIVVVFFQYKSYERDLDKLRNEMHQDRIKEMRQLYKDCVAAQKMMLSKYVLWFDNKLMAGATPANVQFLAFSLSSIMLGFHQLMECAMRSRDERLVKEQIGAFKCFFDKVRQHPDQRVKNMWSSASAGLKTVVVKKDDESIRGDYESVLKVGSESFEWLESFYKDFASWKFA